MDCTIYNLQYVGKNETPFNISFSNHRKLSNNGHRFNEHESFMIAVRLAKTNLDKNLKGKSYPKSKLLDTKIRNSLS